MDLRCPRCNNIHDAMQSVCDFCGQVLAGNPLLGAAALVDPQSNVSSRPAHWNSGHSGLEASHADRDGVIVGKVQDKEETRQPGLTPIIAPRNYTPPDDTVVTFRIERVNESGDLLPPVQVEMRSPRFTGRISNGDTVKVEGTWRPGQILRPAEVHNLSTRSTFHALIDQNQRIGKIISTILFIAILIFAAINLLS